VARADRSGFVLDPATPHDLRRGDHRRPHQLRRAGARHAPASGRRPPARRHNADLPPHRHARLSLGGVGDRPDGAGGPDRRSLASLVRARRDVVESTAPSWALRRRAAAVGPARVPLRRELVLHLSDPGRASPAAGARHRGARHRPAFRAARGADPRDRRRHGRRGHRAGGFRDSSARVRHPGGGRQGSDLADRGIR